MLRYKLCLRSMNRILSSKIARNRRRRKRVGHNRAVTLADQDEKDPDYKTHHILTNIYLLSLIISRKKTDKT